jgi:endonuclease YncB( thermonuclease family)
MRDNVYKFRKTKWAVPKRLEMIADLKPKQCGSRYTSGLIILCVLIGFVAIQAWTKLSTEPKSTATESVSTSTSISVRVVDEHTISLDDGRPNIVGQAWTKLPTAPKSTATESVSTPTSISVRVIDGDTISLDDGRPNIRLVGFNAPETGNRARCEAERQKGEAAKRRLSQLVSSGRSDFQQIACSCAPGAEGTDACNFGRRCGTLRVHGADVGATLIREGLAVPFVCGATSCPTLPRPWC